MKHLFNTCLFPGDKRLAGKIIGEPKPTEVYTSEQLAKMGLVGVYELEPATVGGMK